MKPLAFIHLRNLPSTFVQNSMQSRPPSSRQVIRTERTGQRSESHFRPSGCFILTKISSFFKFQGWFKLIETVVHKKLISKLNMKKSHCF